LFKAIFIIINIHINHSVILIGIKVLSKISNMKNSKIIILAAILIIVACCKDDKKEEKTYPDLKNRSITSIVVDKLNNVWIGTDTGLFLSVGNGFVLRNIPVSNNILSIFYEKSSDLLWVGTSNGLTKVSIVGSGFSCSSISSSDLSNDTIRSSYVDSSSRRWFGTSSGISLNKGSAWKKSKFFLNDIGMMTKIDIEDKNINSIASWDGDYYFATNTTGLYRTYGYKDSVDAFTGASQWGYGYNGYSVSDSMFVVFIDSKGTQWLGGTGGLQAHTGHNSTINNTDYIDVLPDIRVHAVAEAPDGKIWVGTENGIAVFNGTNWTNEPHSLLNPFITAIAFDKDGNAWIGTKKGLVVIK
jgi:ligand-binding sensor domain-containing protein